MNIMEESIHFDMFYFNIICSCVIFRMSPKKTTKKTQKKPETVEELIEEFANTNDDVLDDFEDELDENNSDKIEVPKRGKRGRTANTAKAKKIPKRDIELPIKIDLIQHVKLERSLYDLKDPLYMNRTHKDFTWVEISKKMSEKHPNMDADKCTKMWSSIRESAR